MTTSAREAIPKQPRRRRFNRWRFVFDRELTLANIVDHAYQAHGDVPVFHLAEPLPYRALPDRTITYLPLLRFINRLGNVLRDQVGMQPYDRVGIYKTGDADYYFAALAVIKAGGIAVPINVGMGVAELQQYLAYTGTHILLTDEATYRTSIGDPARLPAVRTWLFPRAPSQFPAAHVDLDIALSQVSDELTPTAMAADRDALIVHTSGTTGFPKGVICTSGSLVQGIKGQLKIQPLTQDDRALSVAPFNHFISYLGLSVALVGRLPMWLMTRFDAHAALRLIDAQRISIYLGFADTYLQMYQAGLDNYSLESIKLWIAGADANHEVHKRAFTRKGAYLRIGGIPIIRSIFADALGSSETGFAALYHFCFSFTRRFDRCAGRPTFAGPKVRIADEQGRTLSRGMVGRLMAKGPTLFKGYWNAHEKLHGVVFDGWWWTGDMGYRDRWGRYYHLDRAVDVIQTRDGPIYTLPLEEELLKHVGVAEAVVVGIPHPTLGEAPIALIQPVRANTFDEHEYMQWCRTQGISQRINALAMVSAEDVPRGVTGKVLKRVLRERFKDFHFREPHSTRAVPVNG